MSLRFSIIIPAYNYGHTLLRAVESALAQPGDDYEVLIIDDGSTDNTPEIITQISQQASDKIRTYRQANAGSAATRNYGIKQSKGDFILFLDADDALMPNALDVLRRVLDARTSAQIIIGSYIVVNPEGHEKYRGNPTPPTSAEKRFSYYLEKKLLASSGATLFSREIFNTLHFPEQFRSAEDIPVYALALALFNTVIIEEPLAKIYSHPKRMRHNADSALAVGLQLVDVIFDPALLPESFMQYKKPFIVRRSLSLFRTLQAGGYPAQARAYFHYAVRNDWRNILKTEYWRKYLLSFFQKSCNRSK